MMDSCIMATRLSVTCPVLFFLLFLTTVPAPAFASLGSSNQSLLDSLASLREQQDQTSSSELTRQSIVESLLPSQQIDLNLSEQITLSDREETIFSSFEMTLSLAESFANIHPGETAQSIIQVVLEGGIAQPVSLSCNLSPSSDGARCFISPSVVTPNASANLTITTEDTLSAGQYTTTITATPEQGPEKTTNFVINVAPRPDDPPIINVPTSQITLNATSPSGAPVPYEGVSANDNVDGTATLEGDTRTITQDDIGRDIAISCNPPSGSTFPIGNTNVTCTARDSSNKTVSKSFFVTIVEPAPQTPTTTTITNTTSPPSELPILFIIMPLIAGIAAAAVIIILIWRRKRSKSTTDIDEGTRWYDDDFRTQ